MEYDNSGGDEYFDEGGKVKKMLVTHLPKQTKLCVKYISCKITNDDFRFSSSLIYALT